MLGRCYSGIKRPVPEPCHLPSSSTEVKAKRSCTVPVCHALIRYRKYLTLIDAVRQCGVFWYFSLCVQPNGMYEVVAKFLPSSRGNVEVVKSVQ